MKHMRVKNKQTSICLNQSQNPWEVEPINKTITDFKLSPSQVDGGDQEKAHIYRPADLLQEGVSPWHGRVFPLVGTCIAGITPTEWSPIVKGQAIMAYLPY